LSDNEAYNVASNKNAEIVYSVDKYPPLSHLKLWF